MAPLSCPSCGLPRAEELFDVAPCPVCGHDGAFPLTADETAPLTSGGLTSPRSPEFTSPRSPESTSPGSPGSRLPLGLLIGFILGGAAGAAGVLGWQALPVRSGDAVQVADAGPARNVDTIRSPLIVPTELAPMPREVVAAPVTPAAPPMKPADPMPPIFNNPLPPKMPVANGPAPEPAPPNPFRPAAPAALLIDNPNGTSDPIVRPGAKLVLRGKVKTLRVRGLEAGAVLDCSDLDAQEIVVTGKIDGASTLWLKCSKGEITFQAKIDGRSRVGIVAPAGTVIFANPDGKRGEGAMIAGGASVEIKAQAAHFHGLIAGAGTKVSLTLTAGGSLLFTHIEGAARLEYSKADPDDSDPTIVWGHIQPPAVVKMIED